MQTDHIGRVSHKLADGVVKQRHRIRVDDRLFRCLHQGTR